MSAQYNDLPDLCPDLPNVSQGSLEVALDFVEEERDRLLALAMVLRQRLEPADPKDPGENDDLNAWRLAQLLEERLTDTGFTDRLRFLLMGPQP